MRLVLDCLALDAESIEAHLEEVVYSFHQLEAFREHSAGWIDYPDCGEMETLLRRIDRAADFIIKHSRTFIVVGIGGSYLGAKAVIEALSPILLPGDGPDILYAGNNLSGEYICEVLEIIRNTDTCVNIVSKSGSTVETDVAMRILVDAMMQKYGEEAKKRIFVTTDGRKGRLLAFAEEHQLERFEIPANIGGRFSVFTPVGLLPMAVAGLDVRAFVEGAGKGMEKYRNPRPDNEALVYAAIRNYFDDSGKDVELFAVFDPRHRGIGEWWVQLFGESCGKEGVGLFPSLVSYTADLHSLGQFVQEGRRNLIETILWLESERCVPIPCIGAEGDYLGGKTLAEISRAAYLGTMQAHRDGGVPCMGIELANGSAEELGELLYFFMIASSLSALAQGLNPFDQPGVEAYKASMRAHLLEDGSE